MGEGEDMTLEEAIEHCENIEACASCKAEHLQLAEWLKELKGYKEQPTIEHRCGKWLAKKYSEGTTRLKCSECGFIYFDYPYEYCPHCGAEMKDVIVDKS